MFRFLIGLLSPAVIIAGLLYLGFMKIWIGLESLLTTIPQF